MTVTQVNDAATFGGNTSKTGAEDTTITGTLTVTDAIDGITTPNFRIADGNGASHGTASINASTDATN